MKRVIRPFRDCKRSREDSSEYITERRRSLQCYDTFSIDSAKHGGTSKCVSTETLGCTTEDSDDISRPFGQRSYKCSTSPATPSPTPFFELLFTRHHGRSSRELVVEDGEVIPDIREQVGSPEAKQDVPIPQHRNTLPFCAEYDGRPVFHSKSISGCIKDLIESRRNREGSAYLIGSASGVKHINNVKKASVTRKVRNPFGQTPVLPETYPFGMLNLSMKYFASKKRLEVHIDSVSNILDSKLYHRGFGVYVKMCMMPRNGAIQAKTCISHNFIKEDTVLVNDVMYFRDLEEGDIGAMAIRFQVCQKGVTVNKCLQYLGETLVWMDEVRIDDLLDSVILAQKLESYYG